jgi:hypothetical protein
MKKTTLEEYYFFNPSDTDIHNSSEGLLSAYEEICKSYHSIDDFRMKLLGYLPLSYILSVLLIDKSQLLAQATVSNTLTSELVGFAAVFAANLLWFCLPMKFAANVSV